MATTPLRLLILEDNEVDAELALHELLNMRPLAGC